MLPRKTKENLEYKYMKNNYISSADENNNKISL
jgi:hypothetical protein